MKRKKMREKTLLMVRPEDIAPNPHNPRLIFDAEELAELSRSIEKVGILVPLTIFENRKKVPPTKFILLDGERRWRCATNLNLTAIPANVVDEPEDVTQNILFMFNIHHYRREWALFPTALKLEVLMKALKTESEAALSNFTGVSRSMIRRCKALLWFPKEYRNILMAKEGKISTDFFIEIYPVAYRLSQEAKYSYPKSIRSFIDACMHKFLENIVSDVKEFRDVRKCMAYHEQAQSFPEFLSKVKDFVRRRTTGLEVFAVPEVEEDRRRKNIIKYISYLNENLRTINVGLLSDLYVVDQLEELKKNLDNLLDTLE